MGWRSSLGLRYGCRIRICSGRGEGTPGGRPGGCSLALVKGGRSPAGCMGCLIGEGGMLPAWMPNAGAGS